MLVRWLFCHGVLLYCGVALWMTRYGCMTLLILFLRSETDRFSYPFCWLGVLVFLGMTAHLFPQRQASTDSQITLFLVRSQATFRLCSHVPSSSGRGLGRGALCHKEQLLVFITR